MPTPKQVRFHYLKMWKLHRKLALAMNAAHHANVIQYKDFTAESPCSTHCATEDRIDSTTEKQLAQAMKEEILKGQYY